MGGGWAIYEFYYKEVYLPSIQPPHLNISAEISFKEKRKNLLGHEVHFKIENASNTRVQILASWFNLFGFGIFTSSKGLKDDDFVNKITKTELSSQFPRTTVSRHWVYSPTPIVLEAGKLFSQAESYWLDPKEEFSQSLVFFVPDSYDFLKLSFWIRTARDSNDVETCWKVYKNPPFSKGEIGAITIKKTQKNGCNNPNSIDVIGRNNTQDKSFARARGLGATFVIQETVIKQPARKSQNSLQ